MVTTAAWGQNSLQGVLGTGLANTTVYNTPQAMVGNLSLHQITVSTNTFSPPAGLGLVTTGEVWVWGSNSVGQRGDGTTDSLAHSTPAQVPGLANIRTVEINSDNTCFALDSAGTLYGWGRNFGGELNTNNQTQQTTPVVVATGIAQFSGGSAGFLVLLTTSGQVQTIGFNNRGQIGVALNYLSTVNPVLTLQTITPPGTPVKVLGSGNCTYVLMGDGSLWGCGQTLAGQLGTVPPVSANTTNILQAIPGITNVVDIARNHATVYMRDVGGAWYAMGVNTSGILGAGITQATLASTPTPQLMIIPGGVSFVQFSRNIGNQSFFTATALGSDGLQYTWGDGSAGQMGNGLNTAQNPTPIAENGLTALTQVGGAGSTIFASDVPSPVFARGRSYAQVVG